MGAHRSLIGRSWGPTGALQGAVGGPHELYKALLEAHGGPKIHRNSSGHAIPEKLQAIPEKLRAIPDTPGAPGALNLRNSVF